MGGAPGSLQGSGQAIAFQAMGGGHEQRPDDGRQTSRQGNGFALYNDAIVALLETPVPGEAPEIPAAFPGREFVLPGLAVVFDLDNPGSAGGAGPSQRINLLVMSR